MEDTRPKMKLSYTVKELKAHDGIRYVVTAWNDYHGVFLVAPQYPNARYSADSALQEMKKLSEKNNCELESFKS